MMDASLSTPVQPPSMAIPLAKVNGEPIAEAPTDLFIPPDALEVFLEAFEGPLDLLLYLIRRQNLDVLNIPIAEITRQYMQYVALMKAINLELAADYLVMAAMLAEIKSRMLLPRPPKEEDEAHLDPRAELVRRLQEYERYKKAAEELEQLPRMERDSYPAQVERPPFKQLHQPPSVDFKDLLIAFQDVLQRADLYVHHEVQREGLSVRARMSDILKLLTPHSYTHFGDLFQSEEGRRGVVVSLLAILELRKEQLIELVQAGPYEAIHVKRV